MTYIDTWRNKMKNNGGSITASVRRNADKIYTLKFKENDSYKEATILKSDLTEDKLDIRVVNKDSDTNKKLIYLLPRTKVREGSYIKYTDNEDEYIYLVETVENNLESPCCNSTFCNQTLRVGEEIEIPCIAANEGFGVKLTSANEFISESDTKIKVTVQDNVLTRKIPLNTRFILENSEHGIYKISDIAVYKTNVLVYTCKKDKYLPEYDDLENGLAYNGDLDIPSDDNDNTKPTEYIITGEDSIRKGQSEIYTINYSHENGSWEVEDYSNSVEIVNQDNGSITLICLTYGDYITLSYKVNDAVVVSKDIELLR